MPSPAVTMAAMEVWVGAPPGSAAGSATCQPAVLVSASAGASITDAPAAGVAMTVTSSTSAATVAV